MRESACSRGIQSRTSRPNSEQSTRYDALVSFGLQHRDGDGDIELCAHCGDPAVGPCARCHSSVCGDCCVLTDGGVTTYAICTRCDRRGGRSLDSGWGAVRKWMLLLLMALVLFAGVALLLGRR